MTSPQAAAIISSARRVQRVGADVMLISRIIPNQRCTRLVSQSCHTDKAGGESSPGSRGRKQYRRRPYHELNDDGPLLRSIRQHAGQIPHPYGVVNE